MTVIIVICVTVILVAIAAGVAVVAMRRRVQQAARLRRSDRYFKVSLGTAPPPAD